MRYILLSIILLFSIFNSCKNNDELNITEFKFTGKVNNSELSLDNYKLDTPRDTNQTTNRLQLRPIARIFDQIQGNSITFYFFFKDNISYEKINSHKGINLLTHENNFIFSYLSGKYNDQNFNSTTEVENNLIIINHVERILEDSYLPFEYLNIGDAIAIEDELVINSDSLSIEGDFSIKLIELNN